MGQQNETGPAGGSAGTGKGLVLDGTSSPNSPAPAQLQVVCSSGPSVPTWSAPITIVANGSPVPKARARVGRFGGVFTPQRTRAFESYVRLAAATAMNGRAPLEGPVRLEFRAELTIPQSWSRRKRAAAVTGDIRPSGKPDLDNLLKSALDAINTVVIRDDAQITEFRAVKRYGLAPQLILTIYPIDATPSNRRTQS